MGGGDLGITRMVGEGRRLWVWGGREALLEVFSKEGQILGPGMECIRRFWVRKTEPCADVRRESKRVVRRVRNLGLLADNRL